MASVLEIDHYHLIPLSLNSLCAFPFRPLSKKTLVLSRRCSKLNLGIVLDESKVFFPVHRTCISVNRRVITAVARAEQDWLGNGNVKEEVEKGNELPTKEDSASEHLQKASQLQNRIIFGLGIGVSVGGVVLAGGWIFTVALAAAVFVGSREYFELVRSRGITAGMTPPPRYVSRVCSVICALMPLLTLYFGHIDVSVTSAAFVVAMALLVQRGNPRFAQLSSTIFGLFYCGYLPCFWVKLRCGLAAPALNMKSGAQWPIILGGQAHWTVGLVATLISFSSIIAADTFAFIGGKAFGRTPLTNVSPKKTWEGTILGLCGCIATTVILSKILSWPTSLLSAVAFGFLNFFGSVKYSEQKFQKVAYEEVLLLIAGLKYTPSSIIFMKVPSISKFQWHSFSISSSSVVDSQTMSVLIKCEGRWTSSLYNMIQAKLDADQVKCMPIAIEGPYGPSSLNFLRYDSLVLVAGGIGITPFLSILLEIASPKSSNRCILPTRVELIYVVRSSQEICLLNSVSSLLLKQESEKLYLKLKVFVTQEKQSTSTIEELLEKSLSQIQMVNLETDGSSYAVHGVEGLPWMAALIGISSIVFLGILICLNRMLIPSGKKDVKRKSPSWIADVVIISSFIIAICCSTLVAIVLRWRRLNKGIMRVTQKQGKSGEEKWKNSVEEHEIHFGRRPNFVEEILDAFVNKSGRGCNVGVVVCGPESMKQSIALICQQKCPSLEKQYLGFHSLNFTI